MKEFFCEYLRNFLKFLEASGFVYGAMSFVDKVSGGIALMLVQSAMPEPVDSDPMFFQSTLVFVCGGAAILGLLMISLIWPMKIGQR